MKVLVVSTMEYSVTNRGIDIMTMYLVENNHIVDHMVFYTREKKADKLISPNLKQIYFYDKFRLYRNKFRYFLPGCLIDLYFDLLIKNQTIYNFKDYDLVILECGYPVYLFPAISSPVIYRQSDPVEGGVFRTKRSYFKKFEYNIINKSVITSSAVEKVFFPKQFFHKYSFWHSGYIPPNTEPDRTKKKTFVYIGLSSPDFNLIKLIAKKYPNYLFQLIGPFKNKLHFYNVVSTGYLGHEQFEEILSSASVFIMPLIQTDKLKKYSYTSKMFVAMHLGLPILVKKYGLVQKNDEEKKVYVYDTRKQALIALEKIISKIEFEKFDFNVSYNTKMYLKERALENNMKKLQVFFENIFASLHSNN